MEGKTNKTIINNIISDLQRLQVKELTEESVDEIMVELKGIIETLITVNQFVHVITFLRNLTNKTPHDEKTQHEAEERLLNEYWIMKG